MSYSFEYIDIILLAMIAGFIFLRLRGLVGKKSGYEEDITQSFPHEFPNVNPVKKANFDVKTEQTEVSSGSISDVSTEEISGVKFSHLHSWPYINRHYFYYVNN